MRVFSLSEQARAQLLKRSEMLRFVRSSLKDADYSDALIVALLSLKATTLEYILLQK